MVNENRTLSICLGIALLLVIGFLGLVSSSTVAQTPATGIIIEGADGIWARIFQPSTELTDVARNVTSMIIAAYAKSLFGANLYKSDALDQVASAISPRVIVEYANSSLPASLYKSDALNQAAGTVTPRIVVEYANSIFGPNLQRPSFLPPLPPRRYIYLPLIRKDRAWVFEQ